MASRQLFVAFTGPKIEQASAVHQIVPGYECWNLAELGFDDFISAVQSRIPPVNDHVRNSYKKEASELVEPYGVHIEHYQKCSWGLLLPNLVPDAIGPANAEALFVLNLYSPRFLYPAFYASELGIWRPDHRKSSLLYFADQNQAQRFTRQEFVIFYETLASESVYALWQADRVARWTGEDWRVFVACLLYTGLTTYERGKSPFTWQRESADMAALLEALFTAGTDDNREVSYKLTKRVSALMSSRFPDIERQVKTLYKERSDFVHGSFFRTIAKGTKKSKLFAELPLPSFRALYQQKEYIRYALATYLYLNKVRKSGGTDFGGLGSVLEILEASIIDIKLRAEVAKHADKVLSLM